MRRFSGGDKTQIEPLLLVVGMGAVLAQCLMNFPLYLLQIHMLLGLGCTSIAKTSFLGG